MSKYGSEFFNNPDMKDKEQIVNELSVQFYGMHLLDLVDVFYSKSVYVIRKLTLARVFPNNIATASAMEILVFAIFKSKVNIQ